MNYKVLILAADCRNSLAIVRDLVSKGIRCDGLALCRSAKGSWLRKRARSRYFDKVIELSVSDWDPSRRNESLISILAEGGYDCVLAGGTMFSNHLSEFKAEYSEYCAVGAEEYERQKQLHDKESCSLLASRLGIRMPRTFFPKTEEDVAGAFRELDGKAFVKFKDSFASKGLVKYSCEWAEAAQDVMKGVAPDDISNLIIQEVIVGDIYDTNLFCWKGEVEAILSQKRLATAWIRGGGGVANITVEEPDVEVLAKRLAAEIGWSLHLNLEWIRDRVTGEFYFLEANPKFWGTTQLTVSAGYSFPYWCVCRISGKDYNVPESYRVGMLYRWIDEEVLALSRALFLPSLFFPELLKFVGRCFKFPQRTNFNLFDPLRTLSSWAKTARAIGRNGGKSPDPDGAIFRVSE